MACFSRLVVALPTTVILGPNGQQWPPVLLDETAFGGNWHYYEEHETDALGETGYGIEAVLIPNSDSVRMTAVATAKAVPLGGVAGWGMASQYLIQELRCRFRLEHSGDYRVFGSISVDQILKSWGFSTLGDNRGSYDISLVVGLYQDDVPFTGPRVQRQL